MSFTDERTTAEESAADGARGVRVWTVLRPLIMRLHFYAGVFVAPFLLVAAVSGLLYVFSPQLDQLVYDRELHVPAAQSSVPLQRQVELAEAAVPDGTLRAVRPAPTATDTTRVIFDRPGLQESFSQTVFVNPHNGELRGNLQTYGSSSQALPARAWLDLLHRNLHLGDPGRIYTELAASWLWVITLGGLALWIGRRRKQRALRATLLPGRSTPGRKRVLSWHGTVGLWAAIGLLFLSATGLTWSLFAGGHIGELRGELNLTTPSISSTLPSPAKTDVGLDAVRAATSSAGLVGPVEITVPQQASDAYVVQQIKDSWPVRQDSMAVDPATGQITETLRFADYSLVAKLSVWGINAHMGVLFGWVNQVVLVLLVGALIGMIVAGYRMWWLRRPTRGGRRTGRPPTRGGWRRVPGRVLAPLLLAAVVIGYFLPLFGVSLLVFLAIDVALGARARRAAGADEPVDGAGEARDDEAVRT